MHSRTPDIDQQTLNRQEAERAWRELGIVHAFGEFPGFAGMDAPASSGSFFGSPETVEYTLARLAGGRHGEPREFVFVPNTLGLNYEEARAMLEGMGFDVALQWDFGSEMPHGEVLGQDIAGGTAISRGSTVRIHVSGRADTPAPTPAPTPRPGPNTPINNPHSSWARDELARAAEQNLIPATLQQAGVDLREPITRAEFAGIVVLTFENLANATALPAVTDIFADTRDPYVLRAFNAGLMVGISPDRFDPHSLLSRQEAATALTRSFKKATIPGWTFAADREGLLAFTWPAPFADDAHISGWARESVYFMTANNIIQGPGGNIFSPRAMTSAQEAQGYATATREQALIIALRMVENLRWVLMPRASFLRYNLHKNARRRAVALPGAGRALTFSPKKL